LYILRQPQFLEPAPDVHHPSPPTKSKQLGLLNLLMITAAGKPVHPQPMRGVEPSLQQAMRQR
jgi:hypothetical protein